MTTQPQRQHGEDTQTLILQSLLDCLEIDLTAAVALPEVPDRQAAITQAVADFKNLYGRTPAQLAAWARHAARRLPAEQAIANALQGVLDRAKNRLLAQIT